MEETKGDDSFPSTGELELDEMLEVDDNELICRICDERPCDWIQYGEDLIQRGVESFDGETVANNIIRKLLV